MREPVAELGMPGDDHPLGCPSRACARPVRLRDRLSRAVLAMTLVLAQVIGFIGASSRPASSIPVYSYFPSASATDGRMLSVAGDGLSTLWRATP